MMFGSLEEFYAAAKERFTPGGEGRVDWYMSDAEIVAMLTVTNPGYERTGALFVVPTPAGIVAIKPISDLLPGAGEVAALDAAIQHWNERRVPVLEAEFRAGRHDCGYSRSGWCPA